MSTLARLRRCRCCSCEGPVGRRVNLLALERRATWKYPTAGNVLTGECNRAVAVCCDHCLEARRAPVKAIEFAAGDVPAVVYHAVETLEPMP